MPGATNPLYLKVVLSELRVFGAFDQLAAKIANDFGETAESAFDAVLRRLERDPPHASISSGEAVPLIFGLLAHARRGLSADELTSMLVDALALQPAVGEWVTDTIYVVLRQVRPFLGRREAGFDFFYEAFRQAALTRYAAHEAWHQRLADYFAAQPLWIDAGARLPHARKVSELPYHLTLAEDRVRLVETLTDLEFVEAKCSAAQTYELLDDYARVPDALRTPALDEFASFVRAKAHVLTRWPELAFQEAAGGLAPQSLEHRNTAPARAAIYRKTMGLETRPWLRRLNPAPAEEACLMTLVGHKGSVLSVRVSPDGERLLSLGIDGTLRVWDVRTGSPIEVLSGMGNGSRAVLAIVPASTLVAVAARDGETIVLWDYSRLRIVGEMRGPRRVSSLAADASGAQLAAGSTDGLAVYDLRSGERIDVAGVREPVEDVAFAAADEVVCALRSVLLVVDVVCQQVRRRLRIRGEVTTFSHEQRRGLAAVVPWGSAVELWDVRTGSRVKTLPNVNVVQQLAFSPDGCELAAAGLDGTIVIWDVTRGESVTTLRGHGGGVLGIAYAPDGERLFSSSVDGTLRMWDARFRRTFYETARKHFPAIIPRRRLSPGRDAQGVELLLHAMANARQHPIGIMAIQMEPAGRRAVTGDAYQQVRIWNFESGACEHILEGHEHGTGAVALSAGGELVASSDRAATIRVWDARTGALRATRRLARARDGKRGGNLLERLSADMHRPFIELLFLSNGRLLVSAGSLERSIQVWDGATLEPRCRLATSSRATSMIAVGPGRLVSAGGDGAVMLWDVESGRLLAHASGHAAATRHVGQGGTLALLGDGRIACASQDGTIRLLDPESLRETGVLRRSGSLFATVSAYGDLVAAASPFGKHTGMDVWRADGAHLFTQGYASQHVTVACEVDGGRFAVGGPGETLTVWEPGRASPSHRYPVEPTCFAFVRGRLLAADGTGDVLLLELTD